MIYTSDASLMHDSLQHDAGCFINSCKIHGAMTRYGVADLFLWAWFRSAE